MDAASATSIDAATLRALQDNAGADFVVELVDTFADEGPQMLDALRTALAGGDAAGFKRAAHSLKSNAQTFGLLVFAAQARALELDAAAVRAADTAQRVDALAGAFALAIAALREQVRG